MMTIKQAPYLFVVKGYPRLSETFIAQEILALEQRGLPIEIVSLRHPTDKLRHKLHNQIQAPVNYLPEYLGDDILRVWIGFWKSVAMPGFANVVGKFLHDLSRDFTFNRVRRFGQAVVLAAEMPEKVSVLHAHFLHTPCSVTRYAAILHGIDFSFSAHAKDIWTSPDWEIREKLNESAWGVTCTKSGVDHLKSLCDDPDKIQLVYHGLDHGRFPNAPDDRGARDGSDANDPVRIISVGRLVEKKGYDDLLVALSKLPKDLNWRLMHVGGGELSDNLMLQAATLGFADKIEWLGPQSQDRVVESLRASDIFVLASRIADDGDRDGLPNVLMEAATQGTAIISTNVSAIPEFIKTCDQGLLVNQKDPDGLSAALSRFITDPALRDQCAASALKRVHTDFSMDLGIDQLERLLRTPGETKKI
jgi:glycosyltransferase involved in cell wall biosynthesis